MTDSMGLDFIIRLVINTTAILYLVRVCYFSYSQHRAYASSFILFGLGVFLVTSQLHTVDISMGFAFGLFAIFSMLRYRTESITIKEMTYLFLVIAMSLLSAGPSAGPTRSVDRGRRRREVDGGTVQDAGHDAVLDEVPPRQRFELGARP